MAILKRGLAGEPVTILQQKLGVTADGEFGPGTEKALRDYQSAHGLSVDGIAGPDTFAAMGLYELVLLKVGTHGTTVKKMQEALGIAADGQFGPGTAKAVMDFQSKNGLDADGMAGPETLAKMALFKEMTPEVIKRSQVTVGSTASAATAGGTAASTVGTTASPEAAAPKRSVWGTIKGFFGK